jgi:hypothetical protein
MLALQDVKLRPHVLTGNGDLMEDLLKIGNCLT